MNKPKRDHAVQEAPTEWRKILLEEGPNGELIPVGLEPMTPTNGPTPTRSPQPVTSPSSTDLPDEWQSVFEEASTSQPNRAANNNISLQQELPEFSDNTIPGMQLPEILKKEMQDPNNGEMVASHIRNAPQVQEILNKSGAQKIPPPRQDIHLHDNGLFEPEPGERTIANHRPQPPTKKPMVVPTPQISEEDPAPNAIPAELAAKLGRGPQPLPHETPHDLEAFSEQDLHQDPPTYDSHSLHGTHHPSPDVQYDTSDSYEEHMQYETDDLQDEKTSFIQQDELSEIRALHQAHNEEVEEEVSNESTAASPIPRAPIPRAPLPSISPTPAPEMSSTLHLLLQKQQEQIQELLQLTRDQHKLLQEQQEESRELRRSLERVSTELDTDREETRFQALYGLFQDLLLLFDYVDLRYRSLWDSHGEHHPAVHEASAFRKRLLDILKEQGLHPIDVNSYEFDPTSHRALQEVPTPHHNEDQQISRIFRQGFRYNEKVFRPTEVEIKRYSP
ncbi:MAG: nucleotide exchange factor GrpE [Myxococcales bacterium]|nr:nucleotide exchange factor GrpE [Myxococcales bacterium]MCB9643024.1 nucleotide exchange factor GrpE [Myxococcales bacterium]